MRKVGAVVLGLAFYTPMPIWLVYLVWACRGMFGW